MRIKSLVKKPFLSILLLFAVFPAKAQWSLTKGPYFGNVQSFAVLDDMIFGVAGGGYLYRSLYKSIDHGLNWEHVGSADTLRIESFLIRNKIIFVAGYKGIFKSTDGGIHWTTCNIAIAYGLLAQNSKYIFAANYEGNMVFRSSDDGNSWILSDSLLPRQVTHSIFANDTVILVGEGAGSLYRSADLGHTWSIPDGITNLSCNMIKSDSNEIFAGGISGLYRSIDEGRTWTLSDTNDDLDITRQGKYLFAVGYKGIFAARMRGYDGNRRTPDLMI